MNNIGRIVTVNRNNWNILYQDKNIIGTIRQKKNNDDLPVVGDYV